LTGLANGIEESKVPKLEYELRQIATKIAKATAAANRNDSSAAAITLIGIADVFKQLSVDVGQASLTASEKSALLARLEEKREQAETALNEALGVTLEAEVVSRWGRMAKP